MNWVVKISDDAELYIDNLPSKIRGQISRSIDQLQQNPFRGDVKPLTGAAWKGYYRKRVGDYRIIFFPHHKRKFIDVSDIILRSEKTYR